MGFFGLGESVKKGELLLFAIHGIAALAHPWTSRSSLPFLITLFDFDFFYSLTTRFFNEWSFTSFSCLLLQLLAKRIFALYKLAVFFIKGCIFWIAGFVTI